MEIVAVVLAVAVILLGAILAVVIRRNPNNPTLSEDILRAQFQTLSQDALAKSSEQFLNLAEQRFARQTEAGTRELDTKKQLIDQQMAAINSRLEEVGKLVRETDTKREASFAQLTTHLQTIGQQTANLTSSTTTLREALSSSRVRGQWGERMAEDILRLLGFIEGINFYKQETIEGIGSRPDFVFPLPGDLRMNMDVKFPYDNYVKFLDEQAEPQRGQYRAAFLRDVRARIREITTRDYIDPERGTVDYVLLFIPNESIYAFIHESDSTILDTALKNKVICCSPFTLFAVLAVVRQAVDNFALQKASEEIIGLFGRFYSEWGKFTESLLTLGNRLASTQRSYEQIAGPRKRMLERPLRQIESLRQQQGLPVAAGLDDQESLQDGRYQLESLDVSDEVDSEDLDSSDEMIKAQEQEKFLPSRVITGRRPATAIGRKAPRTFFTRLVAPDGAVFMPPMRGDSANDLEALSGITGMDMSGKSTAAKQRLLDDAGWKYEVGQAQ